MEAIDKDGQVKEWDYADQGVSWPDIFPGQCDGRLQSPIDLSPEAGSEAPDLRIEGVRFKNYEERLAAFQNGAISIDLTAGEHDVGQMSLTFGDGSEGQYSPVMMIFKSPSEHTFGAKRHDLEGQIYFKDAESTDGRLTAALSVFWDQKAGKTNCPFLNTVRPHLVSTDEADPLLIFDVTLKSMLGTIDFRYFYSYEGSLPFPPCDEGIKWTVSGKQRPISEK